MELKVKEVVKVEKSQAQVEEELLKQNEEKQAALEEAAEQPAEQTETVSEPVQEEKKELDDQTVLDYIRKR